MITSAERISPGWGDVPGAPYDEGFHIWDLADPENPEHLGQFKTGGGGTHRNYYDGGRYVYATGLPEGVMKATSCRSSISTIRATPGRDFTLVAQRPVESQGRDRRAARNAASWRRLCAGAVCSSALWWWRVRHPLHFRQARSRSSLPICPSRRRFSPLSPCTRRCPYRSASSSSSIPRRSPRIATSLWAMPASSTSRMRPSRVCARSFRYRNRPKVLPRQEFLREGRALRAA